MCILAARWNLKIRPSAVTFKFQRSLNNNLTYSILWFIFLRILFLNLIIRLNFEIAFFFWKYFFSDRYGQVWLIWNFKTIYLIQSLYSSNKIQKIKFCESFPEHILSFIKVYCNSGLSCVVLSFQWNWKFEVAHLVCN